jgi:ectoine hydroxylase-related dioxygenase (phytanoyl-CoA dioxygenase family)
VDLELAACDVLLLHGEVVHGSHPNRSAGLRQALLMTYIRRGAAFRPGLTQKRTEVFL